MNDLLITHIYFGTAGAAGLYIKSIKDTLLLRAEHVFITNYYYPEDGGKRWFFKYTEMTGSNY